MNILITGASGFIGNALLHRLAKEGHTVIGLYHSHQPKDEKIKNAQFIKADITNTSFIKSFDHTIDVIYHCAAYVKDYGPKDLFYKINVEGTKQITKLAKRCNVKKFIYISHIPYEKKNTQNYYAHTKSLAEEYLLNKHKIESFPVVIIRPGSVFGPGASTWVVRPLQSIATNKIALVDHGNGVFLHTYIENLIDALIAVLSADDIFGEYIEITDGGPKITWNTYFNDLAAMIGKKPITRNLSKRTAKLISYMMMGSYRLFKIKPWVTPQAVEIFTNQQEISIQKATNLLHYQPQVSYQQAIQEIKTWVEQNKESILSDASK